MSWMSVMFNDESILVFDQPTEDTAEVSVDVSYSVQGRTGFAQFRFPYDGQSPETTVINRLLSVTKGIRD